VNAGGGEGAIVEVERRDQWKRSGERSPQPPESHVVVRRKTEVFASSKGPCYGHEDPERPDAPIDDERRQRDPDGGDHEPAG